MELEEIIKNVYSHGCPNKLGTPCKYVNTPTKCEECVENAIREAKYVQLSPESEQKPLPMPEVQPVLNSSSDNKTSGGEEYITELSKHFPPVKPESGVVRIPLKMYDALIQNLEGK